MHESKWPWNSETDNVGKAYRKHIAVEDSMHTYIIQGRKIVPFLVGTSVLCPCRAHTYVIMCDSTTKGGGGACVSPPQREGGEHV